MQGYSDEEHSSDEELEDKRKVARIVERGNLSVVLRLWRETKKYDEPLHAKLLLALEEKSELQERLKPHIKLMDAFVGIDGEFDFKSLTKEILNYLLSDEVKKKAGGLGRGFRLVASHVAKLNNYEFIIYLIEQLPHPKSTKSRLISHLIVELIVLLCETESAGSTLIQLLSFAQEFSFRSVVNFTTVALALKTKNRELVRAILTDFFDLHKQGYSQSWKITLADLNYVMKHFPCETTLFVDYLRDVGSPCYEQALEYITRDDV